MNISEYTIHTYSISGLGFRPFQPRLRLYEGPIKALLRAYKGSVKALLVLHSGTIKALVRPYMYIYFGE